MANYYVDQFGNVTSTNKKKKKADYTVSASGKVTKNNDDDIAPVKTTTGAGVNNKLTSLLSVSSSDDFKANSGYVSTKKDGILGRITSRYGMGYDDLQYEYINNKNEVRSFLDSAASMHEYGKTDKGSAYKEKNFDYMTEEEVAVYNYYYNTGGKKKAQEFLDELAETLNSRKASKDFEKLQGNTGREIMYGISSGWDQVERGVKNVGSMILGNDDYIPQTSTQILTGMVREDLADDGVKILGSSLGQIGFDAVTEGTKMTANIAASFIAPWAGTALTGATAAGNAYQEDLNEFGDKNKARAYATTIGVLEYKLQSVLGGIAKLGGTSKTISRAASGIKNGTLRFAAEYGGKIGSEALEEGLQEILDPIVKNAIHGTDENIDWENVAYSAMLGGLMGGTFGFSEVANGRMTNNEQAVVDKIYKDAVAKEEAEGKVSSKRKNEIYEETLKKMERGEIDIDTIEGVLGGKTFEEYKSLNEKEKALQDEIRMLSSDPRPAAQTRDRKSVV